MDEAGSCQQVYAVDGLGGAQFASSLALEQLRQERSAEPVLLAATDPANPLGVTMPWPDITGSRPQRKAGALVLLAGDGPHFYLDGSGRSLLMWPDATTESANTFVTALRKRRGRLGIKRVNGEEALTSPWVPLLVEAGLRQTPSGLR
jgi:ATP-dependent Lhr-like helicase